MPKRKVRRNDKKSKTKKSTTLAHIKIEAESEDSEENDNNEELSTFDDVCIINYEPHESMTATVKAEPVENIHQVEEITIESEQYLHFAPNSNKPTAVKVKSEKIELQCEICEKIFARRNALVLHLKKKICSKNGFQCEKCGRKFEFKNKLKKHDCSTKCKYCGKNFKTNGILFGHMKKMHTKELNVKLYECDLCDAKLLYKSHLITHMNENHLKNQKFICDYDERVYYDKIKFVKHMQSHFMMINCKICETKLKPYLLDIHIKRVHVNENNFECKTCQKKFKSKINLTAHMKMHEKRFHCEICDRKFALKFQLIYHLKDHENQREFKCNICSSSFNIKNHLTRHMIIHDKDAKKRHKCTQCVYSTYSAGALKSHMKRHKIKEKLL